MKKNKLICVVLFVTVVVAMLAWGYLARVVPYWQCSEVYKRYSRVEGVRATYVKDYRINDTLTVAVTLLEATDSAGWNYLLEQLNISPEMQIVMKQMDVNSWQSPRGKPETRAITKGDGRDTNLTENDIEICACSFSRFQMCVFHTRSKNEIDAVDNYNYDYMINNSNN